MHRFARVSTLAAVGLGVLIATPVPAGAALTSTFSMSPTSGPAGTSVAVSGSNCAPGLLLSPAQDRVVVTMATVPSTTAQIPVSSRGAWSGHLTVPADAAAAPALVTVVCFTDGLQSLLAIYLPKTFTVTAAPATPTTGPATTTTRPETSQQPPPPATGPTTTGGTPPTTPRTRPKGSDTGGGTGGGRGTGSGPAPGGSQPAPGVSTGPASGNGGSGPAAAQTARADRRAGGPGDVSDPANLQTPTLASADVGGDSGGLGWIGWLGLVLLLGGFAGGALLYRRMHREREVPQP